MAKYLKLHYLSPQRLFIVQFIVKFSSFIDVFKPPVLPVGAKTKKKTTKPKNALSSLLAYEESDSDGES